MGINVVLPEFADEEHPPLEITPETLTGSPEELAAELRAYADMGVGHIQVALEPDHAAARSTTSARHVAPCSGESALGDAQQDVDGRGARRQAAQRRPNHPDAADRAARPAAVADEADAVLLDQHPHRRPAPRPLAQVRRDGRAMLLRARNARAAARGPSELG